MTCRKPNWNSLYTEAGAYFVTLVTHERECLFGNATESGEMVLTELGQIVFEDLNCALRFSQMLIYF
jgi:hypothetical protein